MTGSQSLKGWKGAIAAQERHYLPKCKQASLLTKTSGALDGHHPPEKERQRYSQETEQQGEATVAAIALAQLLGYLGLGRAQNAANQICASEGFLSAEPERLRPGRCMKPGAGLRRFPGRAT